MKKLNVILIVMSIFLPTLSLAVGAESDIDRAAIVARILARRPTCGADEIQLLNPDDYAITRKSSSFLPPVLSHFHNSGADTVQDYEQRLLADSCHYSNSGMRKCSAFLCAKSGFVAIIPEVMQEYDDAMVVYAAKYAVINYQTPCHRRHMFFNPWRSIVAHGFMHDQDSDSAGEGDTSHAMPLDGVRVKLRLFTSSGRLAVAMEKESPRAHDFVLELAWDHVVEKMLISVVDVEFPPEFMLGGRPVVNNKSTFITAHYMQDLHKLGDENAGVTISVQDMLRYRGFEVADDVQLDDVLDPIKVRMPDDLDSFIKLLAAPGEVTDPQGRETDGADN